MVSDLQLVLFSEGDGERLFCPTDGVIARAIWDTIPVGLNGGWGRCWGGGGGQDHHGEGKGRVTEQGEDLRDRRTQWAEGGCLQRSQRAGTLGSRTRQQESPWDPEATPVYASSPLLLPAFLWASFHPGFFLECAVFLPAL